jgi:hypothetical protein
VCAALCSPDGGYEDERCFALKIAFYLDPLDQYSGCVRLLPGSHKNSSPWRADQAMQLMTEMNIAPTDLPGQLPVPTQPGDIVVFNHKTYHASFGGGQRRRMFTVRAVFVCLLAPLPTASARISCGRTDARCVCSTLDLICVTCVSPDEHGSRWPERG